jgi:PleD family two-component response regulator
LKIALLQQSGHLALLNAKSKPLGAFHKLFLGYDICSKIAYHRCYDAIGKAHLIVDDEPDITYKMKKIFQLNSTLADSFNDTEEALSHFKRRGYGLLILNIRMSKMNGFELIGQYATLEISQLAA